MGWERGRGEGRGWGGRRVRGTYNHHPTTVVVRTLGRNRDSRTTGQQDNRTIKEQKRGSESEERGYDWGDGLEVG
jgi:hypothetical protein